MKGKDRVSLFLIAAGVALAWPGPIASGGATADAPAATPEPSRDRFHLSDHLRLSAIGSGAFGGSTADPAELAVGGHDPRQNVNLQSIEFYGEMLWDPHFDAAINWVMFLDGDDEFDSEVEEAFGRIKGIPGGLTLKGGRYLAEYGRINRQHLHQWAFIDYPIVNARFLGDHGLRGDGGQVSWLLPTPFFSELHLGAVSIEEHSHSHGHEHEHAAGAGFAVEEPHDAGLRDWAFSARWSAATDLSPTQTVVGGLSYALGENGFGAGSNTHVLGADVYWRWKPERSERGFPFVSWQTEALLRHFDAELVHAEHHHHGDEHGHDAEHAEEGEAHHDHDSETRGESLTEFGFYSQLNYGFVQNWIAGVRSEWVSGLEALGEEGRERWRISPALTWQFKEETYIRLQYNCDWGRDFGTDHSVWVQVGIALGPHGGHSY